MSDRNVDNLNIKISAYANDATASLDKLVRTLGRVSASLSAVNSRGLSTMGSGINRLSNAMSNFSKSTKTTDFTRLGKNITSLTQKIASLDSASISKASSALGMLTSGMKSLGSVSENAAAIGEMVKNISKLGNKSVLKAIENIPNLTKALNDMMVSLSKAPSVSRNVIEMTNAMANLASQGQKTGSASRSLSKNFNQYRNSADKATKSSKGLASAIGMLYAKFWVFQRAFQGLFAAINSSMDFQETVNYFEVAMGKIGEDASSKYAEYGYESAEAYANSFSERSKQLAEKMTGFSVDEGGNAEITGEKNLGLDPNVVLQYQAQFAQMADSIGMTEESALATSKALTMLGTDWASLRNISFDSAWEKFASALAGQSRAVRSLGIDITMTTLQEYAYQNGIYDSISTMSQAEKAQLRLLAILDQSKVAYADLANTISSPANQLRILQQGFSNLSRIIGNLFLPIVSKVLPYINGVVIALQRLFIWIGKILGVKFENINTSMGGMDDSIGDLVAGTEDEVGALDDANTAAKKLKNTILGFDELHILNDQDTSEISGSGGGGATVDVGGYPELDQSIQDALNDYEKTWNEAFDRMNNQATDFADNLESVFKRIWKAAEPTRNALKKLWNEGLSKLAGFVAQGLIDFYDYFLEPLGTWALSEGIPDLVNYLNDLLNWIDWDRMNKNLEKFFKVLEPFTRGIGEGLIDFLKGLMSIGAFVITEIGNAIGALGEVLGLFDPIFLETLGRVFGYVIGTVFTVKAAESFLTAAKKIKEGFTNIINSTSGITNFITSMSQLSGVNVGGVLGVFTGIFAFVSALDANRTKELQKFYDTNATGIQSLTDLSGDVDKLGDSFKDYKKKSDNLKYVADRYFELADQASLTNEEQNLLIGYANTLVTEMPKLDGVIDTTTGKYEGQRDEVEKLVYQTEAYYRTLAYQDILKEYYRKLADLELAQKKNNDELARNREEYKKLREPLNDYLLGKIDENELLELTGYSYSEAVRMSDIYRQSIQEGEKAQQGYNKEISNTNTEITDVNAALQRAQGEMENTASAAQSASGNIKNSFNINLAGQATNTASTYVNALRSSLNNGRATIQDVIKSMFKINAVVGVGVSAIKNGRVQISTYATGGFPEDGLFFANHNELVGRFSNGKTAVANNAQITEGIRAAVVDGMMQVYMATRGANNDNSQPIVLTVYTENDEVLARAVSRGQEKIQRRKTIF